MKTTNNMKKVILAAILVFSTAIGYAQNTGRDGRKAYPVRVEEFEQGDLVITERTYIDTIITPRDSFILLNRDEILQRLDTVEDKVDSILDLLKNKKGADKFDHTKGLHRFGIGVRGGFASHLQDADAKQFKNNLGDWKLGWMAALDLEYTYFFKKRFEDRPWLGIKTGVSLAFSRNPLKNDTHDTYTIADKEQGDDITYRVKADEVTEKDGQLAIEIPLMFALNHKGLFFNVGPRFVIPVYGPYRQKLNATDISVFYNREGVLVPNEVITGVPTEDVKDSKGKWDRSKFHLLLGAEIGYEFALKKGTLGLGLFADYSVFNTFKNDPDGTSFLNVDAPNTETPAVVSLRSLTDNYAEKIGYFDAGIKLVYNFYFQKRNK